LVAEDIGQDCGMVHWLFISATRKPLCVRGARRICIAFGLHFIVCKKYQFSPTFGSHVLSHLTCLASMCVPSVLTSRTLTRAASHAAQATTHTRQLSMNPQFWDHSTTHHQHLSHCHSYPSVSQKRQLEVLLKPSQRSSHKPRPRSNAVIRCRATLTASLHFICQLPRETIGNVLHLTLA
jgi:hypothetical protein